MKTYFLKNRNSFIRKYLAFIMLSNYMYDMGTMRTKDGQINTSR